MARFWICLVKVSQGFEYGSGSKYDKAQNMTRVTQGAQICLNKPEYVLIMMNVVEDAWIYLNKQSSEYVRILNMSDAVQKLLRKVLSSYRNRSVFRELSNIWDSAFCKKNNVCVEWGWILESFGILSIHHK